MGLTSYRSKSAVETLEAINAIKDECGITRLANITGLDNIGIPVYVAMRPNSRSLSLSQGKGFDHVSAKVSALMEAIEGYHAESIQADLITESHHSLNEKGHVIVDIDGLARIKGKSFTPDKVVTWIKAKNLLTDQDILLPYETVHTDYTELDLPDAECFIRGSNGLASGNTYLEAITHALCEVIERDAYAKWFQSIPQEKASVKIDVRTIDSSPCQDLIQKFSDAGLLVGIWDITSNIGVPAFLARIVNSDSPPHSTALPASGFGCHPDKQVALARALTEAAQSRLTFIAGARDDLKRGMYEEYAKGKWHAAWVASIQYSGARPFNEIEQISFESEEDLYQHLMKRLHHAGIQQICCADLSKNHMPIHVVKIVIPYLQGAEDARNVDQKILKEMNEGKSDV